MRLKSDFIDYYDHHFNGNGQVIERLSNGGMNRQEMFEFLQKHGYQVPKHGLVSRLYNPIFPYKKIVVYVDEQAHKGEGKILLSLLESMKYHSSRFACYYIPNPTPISMRHLQVGIHQFQLLYESKTDTWRSNVGEVDIKIVSHKEEYHPTIKEPLFAIDFVKGENEQDYLAIDFNIAPQLKGTGVEEILSPDDVVRAMTEPLLRANGW